MEEDIKRQIKEEQELLEVIQKYNNGEYPMITGTEFSWCLFAFLKLKGKNEFDIEELKLFIIEKLNIEKFRYIFADIDSYNAIQEGISDLEIIYGNALTARIQYSQELAKKLTLSINTEYRHYIEEFADEFQKAHLETKKEKIMRKIKTIHLKITKSYYLK